MKYNWQSLTPRERDALVAEKIMGLNKEDVEFGLNMAKSDMTYQRSLSISILPDYTTDISAAWEVCNKIYSLSEGGATVIKQLYDGMWYCSFNGKGSKQFDVIAEADTAPEAICLAALRAVGVDI